MPNLGAECVSSRSMHRCTPLVADGPTPPSLHTVRYCLAKGCRRPPGTSQYTQNTYNLKKPLLEIICQERGTGIHGATVAGRVRGARSVRRESCHPPWRPAREESERVVTTNGNGKGSGRVARGLGSIGGLHSTHLPPLTCEVRSADGSAPNPRERRAPVPHMARQISSAPSAQVHGVGVHPVRALPS